MEVICFLLGVYTLIVFFRIILGMVVEFMRIPWGHPVRRITDALGVVVDPVLRPIRQLMPGVPMGGLTLDLSPIVLLIGLEIVRRLLC